MDDQEAREDEEESARAQYNDLMRAYAAALVARDTTVPELFSEATLAWDRLRTFPCEEAALPFDMHLLLALSFAIQATDAVEARRLYDSMSEDFQRNIDAVDTFGPTLKIWRITKPKPPP